jgi:hypothetical protein
VVDHFVLVIHGRPVVGVYGRTGQWSWNGQTIFIDTYYAAARCIRRPSVSHDLGAGENVFSDDGEQCFMVSFVDEL